MNLDHIQIKVEQAKIENNPVLAYHTLYLQAAHVNKSFDPYEVRIADEWHGGGSNMRIRVTDNSGNRNWMGYYEFIEKFLENKSGVAVSYLDNEVVVRLSRSVNYYRRVRDGD